MTDKGWGEEISSHRNAYVKRIIEVKGVKLARPLTEKGMYVRFEKQVQLENCFQRGKKWRTGYSTQCRSAKIISYIETAIEATETL